MRTLYRCLLCLHPPGFRLRFSEEMLWIFDEAGPALRRSVFLDGLASIARQWVLRSGSWKAAVAVAAASVQIAMGGLIWLAFRQTGGTSHRGPSAQDAAALADLMRWIVLLSGALVSLVAGVSVWFNKFAARRASRS